MDPISEGRMNVVEVLSVLTVEGCVSSVDTGKEGKGEEGST